MYVARAALDRRAREHVGDRVQRAARQRTARAGVEVRALLEHGELGTEGGGIHGRAQYPGRCAGGPRDCHVSANSVRRPCAVRAGSADARVASVAHEGHAPRRHPARAPRRRHRRRRRRGDRARASRAPRSRSSRTARCATSPRPLIDGEPLEIVTERSGRTRSTLIRHDAAHVLAAAVIELYPGVKISIGPPIEHGFYYDFEFPDGVSLSDADFERIEARMREHVTGRRAVRARGRARRRRRSSASGPRARTTRSS